MSKQTDILRHEPLRVPHGWEGESRALVIQLERILDDTYRRIGDLTKQVKALQEEEE